MRARILIVDDEKLVRWTLRQALEEAGYSAEEAADGRQALEAVARDAPDMVLLDYRLPDILGTQVLRDIREVAPLVPVVMITAHASIGGAVEAIRDGAYDYISKPFEVDEVIQVVARALETGRLREEVARQRERVLTEVGGLQIVAESPAMQSVLRMVQRVATSEATTVLLLGESGVGKGLVARIL
ncbi:MAG: response regulator, partial [Planctomycetota bacterium]